MRDLRRRHDDARSGRTSNWTLHAPVGGSLPGSGLDREPGALRLVRRHARAPRGRFRPRRRPRASAAILALGDVGRVHLYRWGDGGAHFHVWLLPRPLGMVEAAGMMLPLWEDALPNVPDEELTAAAQRVADRDVTARSLARGSARATPS